MYALLHAVLMIEWSVCQIGSYGRHLQAILFVDIVCERKWDISKRRGAGFLLPSLGEACGWSPSKVLYVVCISDLRAAPSSFTVGEVVHTLPELWLLLNLPPTPSRRSRTVPRSLILQELFLAVG